MLNLNRKTREQLESRLAFLESENAKLRRKLNQKKGRSSSTSNTSNTSSSTPSMDMTAERERERQVLREREEEVSALREQMKQSEDRLVEMERDLESKEEMLSEVESQRMATEQKMNKINAQNVEHKAEIERLRANLESNRELQNSWNSHSETLSNIVNDSVKDSNSAMIAALREITKQQLEVYNVLNAMREQLQSVSENQKFVEKEMKQRFDGMEQKMTTRGLLSDFLLDFVHFHEML